MADELDQLNQRTMITNAANEAGIDPQLYHALIQQESGGNPNARSSAGAYGLAQVMPATAAKPGFGVQPFDSTDPQQNVRGGAHILKALLAHYGGDERKALAAYNAGVGRVDKGGPLPAETQKYVPAVEAGAGREQPDEEMTLDSLNARAMRQNASPPIAPMSSHETQVEAAPQGLGGFAKGAWENLNPAGLVDFAKAAYNDPKGTASAALHQWAGQFSKAKEDYNQGNYGKMALHAGAGLLPLVAAPAVAAGAAAGAPLEIAGGLAAAAGWGLAGPMLSDAGDTIAKGDYAYGAGKGVGALAAGELHRLIPGAPNTGRLGALAEQVNPLRAVDAVGQGIHGAAQAVPEHLMNAAHKFTVKERMANPGTNLARLALDEGINPGQWGADKAARKIQRIEAERSSVQGGRFDGGNNWVPDANPRFAPQTHAAAEQALAALEERRMMAQRGMAPGSNVAEIDSLIDEIRNNPEFSVQPTRTVLTPNGQVHVTTPGTPGTVTPGAPHSGVIGAPPPTPIPEFGPTTPPPTTTPGTPATTTVIPIMNATQVADGPRVPIRSSTRATLGAVAEENANTKGRYGLNYGRSFPETEARKSIRRAASNSLKEVFDPLVEAENARNNSGFLGAARNLVGMGADAPTLSELMRRESGLTTLNKTATRGTARVENLNPISLTSSLFGAGAGLLGGGPVGAAIGGVAGHLASKPIPLAMMARGLNAPIELAAKGVKAGRNLGAPAAALANSGQRAVRKDEMQRLYAEYLASQPR